MRFLLSALALAGAALAGPLPLILDTDMGNDVDDVMALAMIHALQSRGHCELVDVTVTKDHELAAPFVDAVNTFYGRPDIPIGVVRDGPTPDPGKFNRLARATRADGSPAFPHDLRTGDEAPGAVAVLRRALAECADRSVVVIQVGFSSNLARLLESEPDDISPFAGKALVERKVRLLSLMAGAFAPIQGNPDYREYNVVNDLPAARQIAEKWPTPRIWSGFEIGIAAPYPHQSILRDYGYSERHPLREAYHLYEPPPHDRPTWDPTSVLQAVLPDHGYFHLSEAGVVTIDPEGVTRFEASSGGRDRHLILDQEAADRVTEAVVQLSSQPGAE